MLRNEKANPRVQQQIIQQIVTPIASKYGHIVDRGTAPNFISDWLQHGRIKKNATAIVTSTNSDSLSGEWEISNCIIKQYALMRLEGMASRETRKSGHCYRNRNLNKEGFWGGLT